MPLPLHCRPEAYRLFAEAAAALDEPGGLLRGAVALAMHGLPQAKPETVERRVDQLAARIRRRVRSGSESGFLAHLHSVLFDEERFSGDRETYDDPRNSLLPSVLRRKKGIPVTLSLLYKSVGERVGLRIAGINSPAHFLVEVATERGAMLVDCFDGGRVLTRTEAFARIEQAAGVAIARSEDLLAAATDALWLRRMLQNLKLSYARRDRLRDAQAMEELQALLPG